MALAEDKTELLNQLKINKNGGNGSEQRAPLNKASMIIVALMSALIGGGLVYLVFGSADQPGVAIGQVPQTSEVLGQALQTSGQAIDRQGLGQDSPGQQKNPAVAGSQSQNSVSAGADSPAAGERLSKSDQILNASGYITARRIATVSAEIMGLLNSVDVEEGMNVRQGQVLAKLDDAVARVNYQLAEGRVEVLEANLNSINADLEEAERELARVLELETKSFSSEAEITRAQTNLDKLRAARVGAAADIQLAKLEVTRQKELLDNHTIRAPFAGVVTVKNAQPGEIVAPSSAGGGFTRTGICTIVDMGSLEIEVDVNEAFIGRVFNDQRVVANLDAYPQWNIPASVIAIIPTADRAKATVKVRIRIELEDSRILPDMGVKVAFLRS